MEKLSVLVVEKRVGIGEECIKVATIYFYRGCRSLFLHINCIDNFIHKLKGVALEFGKEQYYNPTRRDNCE